MISRLIILAWYDGPELISFVNFVNRGTFGVEVLLNILSRHLRPIAFWTTVVIGRIPLAYTG